MSTKSALQSPSALTKLQQNDSMTLVMLTAVGYDYILTFSNEIEFIWNKPWTWVSTLFVVVRYVGLYSLVVFSLVGSTFLPGPAKVCQIMVIVNNWAFCLFFGAAELVMILRVWAMYNRSRIILGTLLTLFSLETIFTVIATVVYSNPKNVRVTIQTLYFSICVVKPSASTEVVTILQIINGTALCVLVIVQFVRQLLQMYRLTRQWQINRYMNLLVKQGILYFVVTFLRLANIGHVLVVLRKLPIRGWQLMLLSIVQYVPMFTLIPRFIISIRVLYARDIQGRRGEGLDTGFGLSSSVRDDGGTTIVFADVLQDEGLECIEEIHMGGETTQSE